MKEGGTSLHKTIREINSVFKGLTKYILALSPDPAQKLGKGPGHPCKNSYVCCVSSLRLEYRIHVHPLPITKFLTHKSSRLVPRPFENGNEANRYFINLET